MKLFLLGLLTLTCCQASWLFGGIHNVENKRQLESKSDIDDFLVKSLKAVEKQVLLLREEVREAREAREEAREESRRFLFDFERKLAAFERKVLKVSAENRNFRIFAERVDKGQH
jgi:hypothetical protein